MDWRAGWQAGRLAPSHSPLTPPPHPTPLPNPAVYQDGDANTKKMIAEAMMKSRDPSSAGSKPEYGGSGGFGGGDFGGGDFGEDV